MKTNLSTIQLINWANSYENSKIFKTFLESSFFDKNNIEYFENTSHV